MVIIFIYRLNIIQGDEFMQNRFIPKLYILLKEGYSRENFINDSLSGFLVAVIAALPMAIALGIASGVGPEKGLYTAIIGGFITSLLGGSRIQIGGPTGTFVVVVFGIIEQYGYNGLATATLMAGIILIFFGIFKFGNFIKYIPSPVIIGFTSGAALLIFSSQIKDILGLNIDKIPSDFVDKIIAIKDNLSSFNLSALVITVTTIIISIIWSRNNKKIPGTLVAIVLTTICVNIFNVPVETIGSKFGNVPNSFGSIALPIFSLELAMKLIKPAFTLAFLAGIESLLSAAVSDGIIGTKHNSNMELIGQGFANIFSPIFGGLPTTGALARTMVNINSGGKTPVSGIMASVTLLLIMIFFGKYATLIPLATLAGVLTMVCYKMSEIDTIYHMKDGPKSDLFVLLVTFLLTVFVSITTAIEFGIIFYAVLFMKKMSDVHYHMSEKKIEKEEEFYDLPEDIALFEINGPLFFGTINDFQKNMNTIEKKSKVLIIHMENVPMIDSAGLSCLKNFYYSFLKKGTKLVFLEPNEQVAKAIKKNKLDVLIGKEFICNNIEEAIKVSEKYIKNGGIY